MHPFLWCQIHWNPNWLQDVFFIYISYLTLKALQHHYFIYFILNQILPLQTCFSYIFVVYYSPLQSYSVHVGPTQSILSTLVLFGPLQFTLVLFSPLCLLSSYSVHLVLFSPLCFYLVQFGPIQSILFTSVLSIHIGSIGSIWSHLVHTVHFHSIRSILILFSPHWSYMNHSIHFGHFLSTLRV